MKNIGTQIEGKEIENSDSKKNEIKVNNEIETTDIEINKLEKTDTNESKDGQWNELLGLGIQTKHIKEGDGAVAEMNTVVCCNMTGYFKDDIDCAYPFECLKNQTFIIGEMDTIPAIELSLR